jgi:hypothetical protein
MHGDIYSRKKLANCGMPRIFDKCCGCILWRWGCFGVLCGIIELSVITSGYGMTSW